MEHIIFVHGMAATKYSWFGIPHSMESLGHTVRNESLPGHVSLQASNIGGLESAEPVVQLMDYVQCVVDQFPPTGDVILVGHSMGGFIISQVAALHPNRVKKLIYVCAMLPQDGETIENVMARSGTYINGVIVEFARLGITPAHKAMGSQPHGPLKEKIALGSNLDHSKRYYIKCTDDLILKSDFQVKMIADWPGTKTRTMESGHVPQKTDPDELLLLLRDIVDNTN